MSEAYRTRHGPGRVYQPDELERFAQFREQRALQRPARCNFAEPCWVEDGPPAMTGHYCGGCGAQPSVGVRRWP